MEQTFLIFLLFFPCSTENDLIFFFFFILLFFHYLLKSEKQKTKCSWSWILQLKRDFLHGIYFFLSFFVCYFDETGASWKTKKHSHVLMKLIWKIIIYCFLFAIFILFLHTCIWILYMKKKVTCFLAINFHYLIDICTWCACFWVQFLIFGQKVFLCSLFLHVNFYN